MRGFVLAAAAVAAAGGVAQPAAAASYLLNFTNNFASVSAAPATSIGEFFDTFSFTTASAMSVSGSLTTQRIRTAPGGNILSDLDFLEVDLDGMLFQTPLGGSDAVETVNLFTSMLAAGDHVLTVRYAANPASFVNGAGYGGGINLGAVSTVPEPTTWGMMLLGFGVVGLAVRRRRTLRSVTA